MNKSRTNDNDERGMATLEFSFVASVYLTMIVGVIAGGMVFWSHNTLMDATRRGARYAASQCSPCDGCCPGSSDALTRIKNVVVYGNPAGTGTPLVPRLTTANVKVEYYNDTANDTGSTLPFGVGRGSVAVSICQQDENVTVCPTTSSTCTAYRYNYLVDKATNLISMPPYRTTLTGESAGLAPEDVE